MSMDILVQPTKCCLTNEPFTEANHLVMLKSGVPLCLKSVKRSTSDGGFVKCPVSEYSYNVKNISEIFQNKELKPEHVTALQRRYDTFLNEIKAVQERLWLMDLTPDPDMDEEEEKTMPWLQLSDISSPDDSSDDDREDHTSFEATSYAQSLVYLLKLKNFRDQLREKKLNLLESGKRIQAEWVDESWQPSAGSPADLKSKAARARRAKRQAERNERRAAIKAGSAKVVHNIHVLNKQIPKKWLTNNPNTPKPPDWEERERAKLGWLTQDEQDELEEEEAEKLTAERIAEWKAGRSAVPSFPGSVNKQRWAERLYRLARRRHYITAKIEGLEDSRQKQLWQKRLDDHEACCEVTREKIAQRIEKVASQGDNQRKQKLVDFFSDAERIGDDEVKAEIEAKRKAEEEAKRKAEEEAEALRKAEEKAKAKAEAEARGETYVDPDEAGDEDEEED